MAVAFGPTSCSSGLVLKSKLLHNPEVQYGFVPKHSHHGGKNPALRAEKPWPLPTPPKGGEFLRIVGVGVRHNNVFYVFASEDVLRCEAMCGDVVACAGACSQAQSHDIDTEARRAKTSKEGFLRFL